ncbi:hypothetical protein JTE90_017639 [Oedothorax gibbosus]|uniref:Uncharacterized protein n=1 Tax=Oedothorax gibbosus TaxID=931172 RepID=A0AAV6U6Q7_9ARAC|nr:hypothetical protein JTE90_017639 [Oedothorax gibbosus]
MYIKFRSMEIKMTGSSYLETPSINVQSVLSFSLEKIISPGISDHTQEKNHLSLLRIELKEIRFSALPSINVQFVPISTVEKIHSSMAHE